jgi:hypothetical protein
MEINHIYDFYNQSGKEGNEPMALCRAWETKSHSQTHLAGDKEQATCSQVAYWKEIAS